MNWQTIAGGVFLGGMILVVVLASFAAVLLLCLTAGERRRGRAERLASVRAALRRTDPRDETPEARDWIECLRRERDSRQRSAEEARANGGPVPTRERWAAEAQVRLDEAIASGGGTTRAYRHCRRCEDVVAHLGERCLACDPVTDRAPPTHPLGWVVVRVRETWCAVAPECPVQQDGRPVERYSPTELGWIRLSTDLAIDARAAAERAAA